MSAEPVVRRALWRWQYEAHELRLRIYRGLPRSMSYDERVGVWNMMSCPCDWCQHPYGS